MDPPARSDAPLPAMLGIAPPEHDVRGRILYLLIHGMGAVVFGYALIAPASEGHPWTQYVTQVMLGVLGCAGISYLADGLRRFKCWAWFFVMGWLAPAWLGTLLGLLFREFDEEAVPAVAGAMMMSGAVHYLWTRRREFWTDAKLESRRPPPRAVTPAWRAARLARIGAETGRARRTVSPRPGALWMRRASAVRR